MRLDVAEFLVKERYFLAALELLHELHEDRGGQASLDDHDASEAARFLERVFADEQRFPRDKITAVAAAKAPASAAAHAVNGGTGGIAEPGVGGGDEQAAEDDDAPLDAMGDDERRDLNFAVREYLVQARYKLTAMTLQDEASSLSCFLLAVSPLSPSALPLCLSTLSPLPQRLACVTVSVHPIFHISLSAPVGDQDWDDWEDGPAKADSALRRYLRHYLRRREASKSAAAAVRAAADLAEMRREMEQRLAGAAREKADVERSLAAASAAAETLKAQVQGMEAERQAQDNELQKLRAELQAASEKVRGHGASEASLLARAEGAERQLDAAQADVSSLRADVASLRAEVASAREELAAAQLESASLKDKIKSMEAAAEAARLEQDEEWEKAGQVAADAERTAAWLQREIDAARKAAADAEAKGEELKAQVQQVRAEAEAQLAEVRAAAAEAKAEAEAKGKAEEVARGEIARVQEVARGEIARMQGELKALRDAQREQAGESGAAPAVAAAAAASGGAGGVGEAEGRIAELQQKLDEARREAEAATAQVEVLRGEMREAGEKSRAERERVEAQAREEVGQLREEAEKRGKEAREAKGELERAQKELDIVRGELARAKSEQKAVGGGGGGGGGAGEESMEVLLEAERKIVELQRDLDAARREAAEARAQADASAKAAAAAAAAAASAAAASAASGGAAAAAAAVGGGKAVEGGVGAGGAEEKRGEAETMEVRRAGAGREGEEAVEDEAVVCLLAECLPRIIPNVLINHREELLPLIMCAIEKHPLEAARKAQVAWLFNLIKKPDEEQRSAVVAACVQLKERVGERRTEAEILSQCWDEMGHKNEEKRLLVVQLCREMAPLMPRRVQDAVLLPMLLQLATDSAPAVREAVAVNLAPLLPLFDDTAVLPKVEEALFLLACDVDGGVVEETLKTLLPAFVAWAKSRRHPFGQVLRGVMQRLMGQIQKCPAVSAVEGSAEARLRMVGERERWNIDVLLRLLTELLPEVRHVAVKTCPEAILALDKPAPAAAPDTAAGGAGGGGGGGGDGGAGSEGGAGGEGSDAVGQRSGSGRLPSAASLGGIEYEETFFTDALLKRYGSAGVDWPAFDWMPMDCLPTLVQLALMLPPKEERLRVRICTLLLTVSKLFGRFYLMAVLLPVFLTAAGHSIDTSHLPPKIASSIEDTPFDPHILPHPLLLPIPRMHSAAPSRPPLERLSRMCVLPLLLAGVLGSPNMREGYLFKYLREWVVSTCARSGAWSPASTPELIDAVRFLCLFEEHRETLSSVGWELVVNQAPAVRITAAVIFQTLAPFVDMKRVSQQVLPALITLGSDPVPEVKHSTIAALGSVAQQFKDAPIVDKIRVQLDSFLEEGSHEAVVAVLKTLTAAVPVTSTTLREYSLQKVASMATGPLLATGTAAKRREKAEALCSALRALEHTEMTPQQTNTLFLPAVQALLKEPDLLSTSSRDALEAIRRDRWVGKIEDLGKYVGKNLFGFETSGQNKNLFGGGLLGSASTASGSAKPGAAGGGGAGGGGGATAASTFSGAFSGAFGQKR
ncbi:unnamed protein product [Closterium sp. Yama58-4]|nr:unnamed protein product [Closterium sp. Yama58-4]